MIYQYLIHKKTVPLGWPLGKPLTNFFIYLFNKAHDPFDNLLAFTPSLFWNFWPWCPFYWPWCPSKFAYIQGQSVPALKKIVIPGLQCEQIIKHSGRSFDKYNKSWQNLALYIDKDLNAEHTEFTMEMVIVVVMH